MRAFLRKDFYVTRKRTLFMMAFIMSFAFMTRFVFVGFAYLLLIAMSLSQSVIAYDERCRWDVFAAMLPVPPQEIVLSKYVYSVLSVCCVGGLAIVVNLACTAVSGGRADLTLKILLLALALVLNAAFVPAIYRIGTKRSQTVLAAAAVVIATLTAALLLDDGKGMTAGAVERAVGWIRSAPAIPLALGAAAAVAAANFVSYQLSVRFYRNRRAGFYD